MGYKNMNHQVFRKSSNLEHYIYNDISSLVLLVFVIFRYEFHILCRLTFYVYGNHSENCFRSETERMYGLAPQVLCLDSQLLFTLQLCASCIHYSINAIAL